MSFRHLSLAVCSLLLFPLFAHAQSPDTSTPEATQVAPTHITNIPPKAVPGFGALGNLGLLPVSAPTVEYAGWITPQPVPEVDQHRLTIQVPVYRDDKNTLSLSGGGTSLHFGGDEFLDSSGTEVPVDLWKVEFGGSYSHDLGSGKVDGGRVSVGSASDHPFSTLGVTTIGASAYYSWASSERSRWMLTVFFSNNNPIINYVPIPGFVYLYQARNIVGMFGLPFSSVVWTPAKAWMLTLSFFGPTVNSEIAYGDSKGTQVFAGFSWLQQSYLRENRPDPNDRLYYDEKHAPVGVRFPVLADLWSQFSVGYAFARSVYEGSRFGQDQDGTVALGDSWFGAWDLRLRI